MDLDCVTRDHEFFFDLVIFVLLGGAVVLKGARLSDSGVIKCVASNILGRCTSTAQFSIEGMNHNALISVELMALSMYSET